MTSEAPATALATGRFVLVHGGSTRGAMTQRKRTYATWIGMRVRCYTKSREGYADYGGRGIVVCDRWLNSFTNFLADMGDRPDGLTIERIDNDGPYSPDNCRWASVAEQQCNRQRSHRITINGVTKTMTEWARLNGVNPVTAQSRIARGMDPEKAVSLCKQSTANHRVRRSALSARVDDTPTRGTP